MARRGGDDFVDVEVVVAIEQAIDVLVRRPRSSRPPRGVELVEQRSLCGAQVISIRHRRMNNGADVGKHRSPGATARRRYAWPLRLGGCASGESGRPSPTRRKPGAEFAVPGLWRPSIARPWRVACGGGDQKSGPAFAPRLLSHARIDRPARVICPPPWPVVARARVMPLMVDQPNSIPVPEGA